MRISDWSSDVCSSDLDPQIAELYRAGPRIGQRQPRRHLGFERGRQVDDDEPAVGGDIGIIARQRDMPRAREDIVGIPGQRSEERRVGKECVSKRSTRLSTSRIQKHLTYTKTQR